MHCCGDSTVVTVLIPDTTWSFYNLFHGKRHFRRSVFFWIVVLALLGCLCFVVDFLFFLQTFPIGSFGVITLVCEKRTITPFYRYTLPKQVTSRESFGHAHVPQKPGRSIGFVRLCQELPLSSHKRKVTNQWFHSWTVHFISVLYAQMTPTFWFVK